MLNEELAKSNAWGHVEEILNKQPPYIGRAPRDTPNPDFARKKIVACSNNDCQRYCTEVITTLDTNLNK